MSKLTAAKLQKVAKDANKLQKVLASQNLTVDAILALKSLTSDNLKRLSAMESFNPIQIYESQFYLAVNFP